MALRDQPYIPLYVQDLLTDEKLIMCSAQSHGVYLRLLCILHKQSIYGKIQLSEKYRLNGDKYENFSYFLSKQMPFDKEIIKSCLKELTEEDVIQTTEDSLSQKRMFHDGEISRKRTDSGRKGGLSKTSSKNEANSEQITEIEIEYDIESEIINDLNSVLSTNYKSTTKETIKLIQARIEEGFTIEDFKKVHRNMFDKWGNNEEMVNYLRPITLYSKKFESYLNIKESRDKEIDKLIFRKDK